MELNNHLLKPVEFPEKHLDAGIVSLQCLHHLTPVGFLSLHHMDRCIHREFVATNVNNESLNKITSICGHEHTVQKIFLPNTPTCCTGIYCLKC